jgi:hypothetical protein
MFMDRTSPKLSSKFIELFALKIFDFYLFFKKHLEETHIEYKCSHCNELFTSKAAFDNHLRICPEIFDECQLGILCTEDMVRKNRFEENK